MDTIKQTLFTNWHLLRWMQLILGIFLVVQALYDRDALSGIMAAYLLFMAVTNTGVCGSGGCSLPGK